MIPATLACVLLSACQESTRPTLPTVIINGRVWHVEIADTPAKRAAGLSGRSRLGPDRGMLFVFERPRVLEFVMRGCVIPLDIAFIDEDMRIIRTCTMHVERDQSNLTVYSSVSPALYALEVPAGTLACVDVKEGDPVTFANVPALAKSPSE